MILKIMSSQNYSVILSYIHVRLHIRYINYLIQFGVFSLFCTLYIMNVTYYWQKNVWDSAQPIRIFFFFLGDCGINISKNIDFIRITTFKMCNRFQTYLFLNCMWNAQFQMGLYNLLQYSDPPFHKLLCKCVCKDIDIRELESDMVRVSRRQTSQFHKVSNFIEYIHQQYLSDH